MRTRRLYVSSVMVVMFVRVMLFVVMFLRAVRFVVLLTCFLARVGDVFVISLLLHCSILSAL
jgi:hypothetical protein